VSDSNDWRLSPEDIKRMQEKNVAENLARRQAASWSAKPHEKRVRVLLGWLVAFGAIGTVALIADFISGVILTASVNSPY
jgi:hypothetical protein